MAFAPPRDVPELPLDRDWFTIQARAVDVVRVHRTPSCVAVSRAFIGGRSRRMVPTPSATSSRSVLVDAGIDLAPGPGRTAQPQTVANAPGTLRPPGV
ncbi:hypothetical protein ACRAWF_04425 [Streptomyces sp. L7]